MNEPVLSVHNLTVSVKENTGYKPIVNRCHFNLYENEILGIVGESGSGKSVTSLAVMGLLPKGMLEGTEGSTHNLGKEIAPLPGKDWENIRRRDISMLVQEPMSSLTPSMKCGKQVAEILEKHTKRSTPAINTQV